MVSAIGTREELMSALMMYHEPNYTALLNMWVEYGGEPLSTCWEEMLVDNGFHLSVKEYGVRAYCSVLIVYMTHIPIAQDKIDILVHDYIRDYFDDYDACVGLVLLEPIVSRTLN